MEQKPTKIFGKQQQLYQQVKQLLQSRGVTTEEIAEITLSLQKDHLPQLTLEDCRIHVEQVLKKREVQNAIFTGIQIDILAEKKQLLSPLQEMVEQDEGLYGIDEILSIAILNVYGSIGLTNYGYLDKMKPGILQQLNNHQNGQVHTFLDDLVGAIAASAAARLAHNNPHASPFMTD